MTRQKWCGVRLKRTGVGLSLNMPFSTGFDAPATETKNTAESGVKYSESGSDVLQNQFESGILEENANKEGNSDVRREETIPDTSNAEGAGRMGEKTAEGKGSNRERISRKIETLLRESSVDGRYNGIKRRGTGRVEKEETAEAFVEQLAKNGVLFDAKSDIYVLLYPSLSFRMTQGGRMLSSPTDLWNPFASLA